MGGIQPTLEMIVACVLGELEPARAEEVRAAVAANAEGAELLARVQALFEVMSTDDSAVPPRRLVDRARALLTPAASPLARWWARAVESVATLVFDSRAQTAAAGFRGSAMGRQLLYSTGHGEVDLAITETPSGGWAIRGQMDVAGGAPVTEVALFAPAAAEPSAVGTPDQAGYFRLETSLPVCHLRFLVGEHVVELGPVHTE